MLRELCKKYRINICPVPLYRKNYLNKEYRLQAKSYWQVLKYPLVDEEEKEFLEELERSGWNVKYKENVPRYFYTLVDGRSLRYKPKKPVRAKPEEEPKPGPKPEPEKEKKETRYRIVIETPATSMPLMEWIAKLKVKIESIHE